MMQVGLVKGKGMLAAAYLDAAVYFMGAVTGSNCSYEVNQGMSALWQIG
jgi:hypothetical protein